LKYFASCTGSKQIYVEYCEREYISLGLVSPWQPFLQEKNYEFIGMTEFPWLYVMYRELDLDKHGLITTHVPDAVQSALNELTLYKDSCSNEINVQVTLGQEHSKKRLSPENIYGFQDTLYSTTPPLVPSEYQLPQQQQQTQPSQSDEVYYMVNTECTSTYAQQAQLQSMMIKEYSNDKKPKKGKLINKSSEGIHRSTDNIHRSTEGIHKSTEGIHKSTEGEQSGSNSFDDLVSGQIYHSTHEDTINANEYSFLL
jgi:hypothetical protein